MRIPIAIPVVLCIAAGGCGLAVERRYAPSYGNAEAFTVHRTSYSIGVPPVGTVRSLWNRYSPLISAINASGDAPPLKLESALTVEVFDRKIADGNLDFAIVDPAKVLIAERYGYELIARSSREDRIRGVVIVAAKSPIRRVADLRRRSIGFSSPGDLAGTMLNELELLDRGVDVRKRMQPMYVRSAESALMNVFLGRVDAAAVAEKDWVEYAAARPDEADDLRVLMRTSDLSGPAVMASSSVPKEDAVRLQRVLARLRRLDAGRSALSRARLSGFTDADSASYDDVWEFLGQYKARFGAVQD